jgi:hypothetical protein
MHIVYTKNFKYTLQDTESGWESSYTLDGVDFFGYGDSPDNAIKDINKSINTYYNELGISTKKPYTKPTLVELTLKEYEDKLVAKEIKEKKPFKPLEVVRNHVNEMIDQLGDEDKCLLTISTELYKKATPTGEDTQAGDIYLACVIRRNGIVPEGYVLSETMTYPAKEIYEFFQNLK